jgi:hypothetical protein
MAITSVGTFPLHGARFQNGIAWIRDAEEWELGINPGGSVAIQEIESIPDQYTAISAVGGMTHIMSMIFHPL